MPIRFPVVSFLLAFLASAGAHAAWQPVPHSGGSEQRVEIDRGRILRLDADRVAAWTRLTLASGLTDPESGKAYDAVQALNHYDCTGRRFKTVKRVYMRDGRSVRVEAVASPKEIAAGMGSLDDRLLTEVCRPPAPSAIHADMRTAGGTEKPQIVAVAENAPEKPAAPERQRFIDLPKIDKSRLDTPGPAPAKPEETKPAAEPKPANKSEAKPAEKAAPKPVERVAEPRPSLSRQALERQYATSGPRKVIPKKKSEEKPAVQEHRDIHWGYEGEGAPANWGKLRPDYGTCATGRRQSPIDIQGGIKLDLEGMRFDYKMAQFRVVDNGHTLQVDVGPGNTLSVMGRRFELLQFHFHKPSEERINGRHFDMVVHLVHRDDEGRLGVVAVLLERGLEHPLIQTIWNHMPLEKGQETQPSVVINLNQLLPENRAYYTYMGSLTTPPCTEDVLWMVFKQPLTVSPEQIAIFSRLYRHNARPIQPSHDRLIKESR